MARELFGTDGIRGVAGQPPLDARSVYAVGNALAAFLTSRGAPPSLVLGIDTRESGPWLARLLAAGAQRGGARTTFAGVIGTPGIAWLARTGGYGAGVILSASHNPFEDNGIKVIGGSGYKFADEQEGRIEELIRERLAAGLEPAEAPLEAEEDLAASYLDYLASTLPGRLDGVHLVLDCANGAVSALAPRLFARLGARVDAIGCQPDGRNINLGCGALDLEPLAREVPARGADLGIAFDGDADRAILVSRTGRIVDGDQVLLICARHLLRTGSLTASSGSEPAVVATVMSNLGLEVALAREGIRLIRTQVGDKYVLEEMLRRGLLLGGEQSGHVIFLGQATTGDGMLTALRVLEVVRATGLGLDELTAGFQPCPQRTRSLRVRAKVPLEELPQAAALERAAREDLADQGRILVRYSGTEPVVRVMVEGFDLAKVEHWTDRLTQALSAEIGE